MFVRVKKVGPYQYLQIAQNRREGKRVKQSIITTLGRLDKLTSSGAIDQLLRSAARFAERLMVLAEHSTDAHHSPDATVVSIGPALIFERLWRETGCQAVVRKLLATRHHHFDVERAVFMSVLHRLMVSGSDRNALQWRRDQAIDGTEALELQHLYRAMGWLGEALGDRAPLRPHAAQAHRAGPRPPAGRQGPEERHRGLLHRPARDADGGQPGGRHPVAHVPACRCMGLAPLWAKPLPGHEALKVPRHRERFLTREELARLGEALTAAPAERLASPRCERCSTAVTWVPASGWKR